ncbi:MAG: serine/threonine-protein kinase [Rhodothermales bacterium]|nr:serine/threonine-protein kinase [Rhodothermales bacterium]
MAGTGRIVGGFRPFTELARRPTTVVYKAYDPAHERFVLLKVLRPEFAHDAALVARFEDEARLLARVVHPNVVPVYEAGQDGDTVYLATAFIEGTDAAALLAAHGPLLPELAAYVLREAACGLAAVHAEGILHRDLKPANILLAHDGRVHLADFGLASLHEAAPEDVRGTLAYLAPEQVLGHTPTPASDLFSLGATFAELLTGERPFGGASRGAALDAVLHHDPLPYLDATVPLPEAQRGLAARLLAKDPAERPTGAALADALDAAGGADAEALAAYLRDPDAYRRAHRRAHRRASRILPAAPTPAGPTPAPPGYIRPLPRRVLLGGALLLLLAAGLGYGGWMALGTNRTVESTRDGFAEPMAFTDWLARHALDSAAVAAPPAAAEETVAPLEETIRLGTLRVESRPPAQVSIGEEAQGMTPLAVPLAAGSHVVLLKHPDFPAYRAAVEVKAGQEEALSVSLWEQVAALQVEVSPWAVVLLDGVVQDTVPPQRRPLIVPPGQHLLTLRHPALGTVNHPIEVAAGEQRTLRFNLYELLGQ